MMRRDILLWDDNVKLPPRQRGVKFSPGRKNDHTSGRQLHRGNRSSCTVPFGHRPGCDVLRYRASVTSDRKNLYAEAPQEDSSI